MKKLISLLAVPVIVFLIAAGGYNPNTGGGLTSISVTTSGGITASVTQTTTRAAIDIGFSGGSSTTLTIGPTGATADYVCTGTDDQTTFATALAALPTGGTLAVKNGDYAFSGILAISKKVNIIGYEYSSQSGDRAWITITGNVYAMQIVNTAGSAGAGTVIQGLGFKCVRTAFESMLSISQDNVKISDCVFTTDTPYDYVNSVGITASGNNIIIKNNQFNHLAHGMGIGGSEHCVIDNNNFYDLAYKGIWMDDNAPMKNSIISNNFFYSQQGMTHGTLSTGNSYSTVCSVASSGLKIVNNTFDCNGIAIEIDDASNSTGADGFIIANNTFVASNAYLAPSHCVKLLGAKNCVVSGNTLANARTTHIYLADGTNGVHSASNAIFANKNLATSTNTYVVAEADANQDYNILRGNEFTAGSSGIADLKGTHSVNRDASNAGAPAIVTITDPTYTITSADNGKLLTNSGATADTVWSFSPLVDLGSSFQVQVVNEVGLGGIDTYAKLMLHLDNNATDSSADNNTPTATGITYANSAGAFKFGYAGVFDGSHQITFPDSDSWNFGTGDFTIDFWLKFGSSSPNNQGLICQLDTGNLASIWQLYYDAGKIELYATDAGQSTAIDVYATWAPIGNIWYHVSLVRYGTDFSFYINGTRIGGGTSAGTMPSNAQLLRIGNKYANGYMTGSLDEVRITKGLARWTANFAPPVSPYTTNASAITLAPASGEQLPATSAINRNLKSTVKDDFIAIRASNTGIISTGVFPSASNWVDTAP